MAEIVTAIIFVVLTYKFGLKLPTFAILFFITVLISICITDFKAKIIPHELTYPAILIGIAFSALYRKDILGALAGIGISYIFFDFLAFYGLKIYLRINQPTVKSSERFISIDKPAGAQAKKHGFISSSLHEGWRSITKPFVKKNIQVPACILKVCL